MMWAKWTNPQYTLQRRTTSWVCICSKSPNFWVSLQRRQWMEKLLMWKLERWLRLCGNKYREHKTQWKCDLEEGETRRIVRDFWESQDKSLQISKMQKWKFENQKICLQARLNVNIWGHSTWLHKMGLLGFKWLYKMSLCFTGQFIGFMVQKP